MILKVKYVCLRLEIMEQIKGAFQWWISSSLLGELFFITLEHSYCHTWGTVKAHTVSSKFIIIWQVFISCRVLFFLLFWVFYPCCRSGE